MKRFLLLGLIACGSATPAAKPAPPPPVVEAPVTPPPAVATRPPPPPEDPYLWLEDVDAERSLTFAREQNKKAQAELEAVPTFAATQARILKILDAKDKIAYVGKRGKWLYNFWQDDTNPRGLWRRTTLAEYRKAAPKWEVLLDLDALNKAESASWVWKGADCLFPKYERCLLSLSRGGADAVVIREFDVSKKAFVADGFVVPEGKTEMSWKDLDTVSIGTDFGPGSLTSSGYPRVIKEWKRGTPLTAATMIFEGKETDVSVSVSRQHDHGRIHDVASRSPTFFSSESFLMTGGKLVKIDKPDDASYGTWDDQILITLRTPWTVEGTTWPAGSMLIGNEKDYLAGSRKLTALFAPTPTTSLADVAATKTKLYVTELADVHDVLYVWNRGKGGWKRTAIATPPLASFSTAPWDDDENDDYWIYDSGFLSPTSVTLVQGGKKETLKTGPARFDAKNLEVSQHFVKSKDGTRVPYFMVAKKDLVLDGSTPTIIEGYGGFELSLTPGYNPLVGVTWLERGGVYVVPNLRGGGEYGPTWHEAAIKLNRQRVYEDFAAIAEDLIARKVTRPDKLGIIGGSNGGLLVGVMMTERPELFGAVVCEAPLLDMKRYNKLLAGASWMGEYGDPAVPEEWAAISKYSPYQNVHAGTKYPRVLFTTSTRDDRVHPGHARKMAARMIEQGHDVLFYENIEGGHAGAADNGQRAFMTTLAYAFLWKQLGVQGK